MDEVEARRSMQASPTLARALEQDFAWFWRFSSCGGVLS